MKKPVSFYPGPSRIYSKVPKFIKTAYENGILSMNHRSPGFSELLQDNDRVLKEKLNIPKDYKIFYVSSATECWEIIAQSITAKTGSYHIFNGAFGERWFNYSRSITENATALEFNDQDQLNVTNISPGESTICITQNETSNGSQIKPETLKKIRSVFSKNLIAVDATSSMAGLFLDFNNADLWFASVQKCFGLPSGLALLICSPKAIKRCMEITERDHYNSLIFIEENMKKWQTTHTPNILGIYLLNQVMHSRKNIEKVDKQLTIRSLAWTKFLDASEVMEFYIKNPAIRSETVITLKANQNFIKRIKENALEEGFILGNGYGELAKSTIRIANFPAIKKSEIKSLREFLTLWM